MVTGDRRCGGSRRTPGATSARRMGIGASGGRGDEIRGRGRMGWIRMLTGERMRGDGSRAAAGKETGRIGEAEVVQRSAAAVASANGLGEGCRSVGKSSTAEAAADVAPNGRERSHHGLARAGPNYNCNVVFTCTHEG
uniref:Uncharacterized protein n=1 Tax=Oryza barthii TaxID=65489 RepID=A0A0D3F8L0_9ORYZ